MGTAAPSTPESDLRPGSQFGPYEIVWRLGGGAFADVYLVRHLTLKTQQALKVVRSSEAAPRELQGAQIMNRLRHENLVAVLDARWIDGRLAIAMDYVEGQTLRQRIEQDGAIDPEFARRIALGITRGLAELHKLRMPDGSPVAHLDLKPSNVLLDANSVPRIADFGVSQLLNPDVEGPGMVGSPSYMAPEQFEGKPSQQSDIWSVGLILYQMLSGSRLLCTASVYEFPVAVREGLVALPKHLESAPPALAAIIQRCLVPDLADRFSSASELGDALAQASIASGGRCPSCGSALQPGGLCSECTLAVRKPKSSTTPWPPSRTQQKWSKPLRGIWIAGAIVSICLILFSLNRARVVSLVDRAVAVKKESADQAWSAATQLDRSKEGTPDQRIQLFENYLRRFPASANAVEARTRLAQWQTDLAHLSEAEALERRPDVKISQALAEWNTVFATASTGLIQAKAKERFEYWQDRLDHYDGFAQLRVLSAAGLPPVHRLLIGEALPSSYFILVEDNQVLFQSKIISNDANPAWDETVRIALGSVHTSKLEIYRRDIFSSQLLLTASLNAPPADGKFQLADKSIIVKLEILREH